MKRFFALCFFACCIAVLSACQTSELSNIPNSVSTDETTVKAPVRAIPVNPLDYIGEQTLTTQLSPIDNLLANPDFEFGSLDSWTACETGGIKLSNDAYEGSGALEVVKGNCFYQSVAIGPDTELTLSCYAKLLSGNGWTGLGLGFADSNWNTIGDGVSTIITGNSYQRYDVNATSPKNTKYVSMWFYSDNPAVVDSCSLYPEFDPPPPPPSSGDNLLENPDFMGLFEWSLGCSGAVGTETSGGASVRNGGCIDQSLSASDISELQGKDYTYSCSVKNTGGYASMSIFLDGQPTSVVIPKNSSFQTVEVQGTAANNINSGFVSLYAEGESLVIASCSLSAKGDPPPPSGDNLLDNGGFENAFTDDNWNIGCFRRANRFVDATRANSGEAYLLLNGGTCVDQSFDTAKLTGNQFSFSCYVRNELGGYAALSIFFDGTPTSKVVPQSDDYQLVEITGVAPNASSGFVSLYTEGSVNIDDCSLTVKGDGVQPGTQQWFDRFGNTAEGVEESVDTVDLTSSGIYTAGRVINSNTDEYYSFIRKYDSDGNVIFTKNLSAALNYRGASVDTNGNTYILLTKRGPSDTPNSNTLEAYVQKYNPTGALLYSKLVRTTTYYVGNSTAYQAYSGIEVTEDAFYLRGRADGGVFKFDLSGNLLWTGPIGLGFYTLYDLAVNPDGSVYIITSDRSRIEPRLTKLNSNGSIVWQKILNTGSFPKHLVTDGTDVYVMGSDPLKAYLWKYDSAGNEIFTRQYADGDSLGSAAIYKNALYTTGYSVIEDAEDSTPERIGFIKKINTQTGDEEWSTSLDTEEYNIYSDIAIDDTGIYVGGYLADLGIVGNSQFPTNRDAFVGKYSLP